MLRFLQRISASVWCLLMLVPLFLAAINIGVLHAVMRAMAAVFVELWYLSAFESFKTVADEYYRSARARFRFSFYFMVLVVSISMVFDVLHTFSVLPESVIGIISSVSFFVSSIVFVMQLVILMNVSTFNLAADEFKRVRVKWLLAYLVAPIGVFWVMPKIKELVK